MKALAARLGFWGLLWHVSTVLWMGLLAHLTRMTGDESAGLSYTLAMTLHTLLAWIDISALNFIVRKLAHFGVYFTLGCFTTLAANSWSVKANRVFFAGALVASAYGVIDEVHQYFVPGRVMSGFDMLINAAGAFAGAGVILLALWSGGRRCQKILKGESFE